MDALFLVNSLLLGVGLAMDAFSVSLANGLREPDMKPYKVCAIAGMFAFFQALMPMIGWLCVHTIMQLFQAFEQFIPWIALLLLGYIGGKMLWDGFHEQDGDAGAMAIGFWALFIQGIATSIDALSVGFTIADYPLQKAFAAAGVIALVTFFICVLGVILGKKFGTRLSGKATCLGGFILIALGIEIFISGILG